MFRIDRLANAIVPLRAITFGELEFRERSHLQEWIAKHPSCLGEDLLIIQKEFSGFLETSERLDLLALDKKGSLVIIENKLDDSGRDVTWQAIKYASYCSSLKKEEVVKIYQEYLDRTSQPKRAETEISEFLEVEDLSDVAINSSVSQRIVLVAAHFRKEVTSSAIWLRSFKLQIQCVRVTPYAMGDEIFLDIEQIIPPRDAEEFMIKMADKAMEEAEGIAEEKTRHRIRRHFWTKLLTQFAAKSNLFQNISPSTHGWIAAGSGIRGVAYTFSAGRAYGRAELYIDRGDRDENKFIFDKLNELATSIESKFGAQLSWERLNDKRASRIKSEMSGNIFDEQQQQGMIDFMIDAMVRLETALREPLVDIGRALKSKSINP